MIQTSETPHTSGYLAAQYGFEHLPLEVLQSAAGFYLGTFDPEEGPCSRESWEYWATREEALSAWVSGQWTQRAHP